MWRREEHGRCCSSQKGLQRCLNAQHSHAPEVAPRPTHTQDTDDVCELSVQRENLSVQGAHARAHAHLWPQSSICITPILFLSCTENWNDMHHWISFYDTDFFFFFEGGVHKALPTYAPMKPKTQRMCCKHLQEKDWKSPRIREEKNSLLFFLDYRGGNVISLLLNSQDYFIKKKICIYVSQPQINHFPSSFSSHNDLYAARLNPFFVLQIEALTHTMKSRIHTWWWHPCSLYISFF